MVFQRGLMRCQERLVGTMAALCAKKWNRRGSGILQNFTTAIEKFGLWTGVSLKFSLLGATYLVYCKELYKS